MPGRSRYIVESMQGLARPRVFGPWSTTIAALVGVVFLAAGILGLVPGVTAHYGDLGVAGDGSGAKLLDAFQVSILQDVVHVLFGIAGLVSARTASGARAFLIGGGILSLALWFLGAAGAGGWLSLNPADNWLHFLPGIAMIGLGYAAGRTAADVATA